jgi:hypothetical protein
MIARCRALFAQQSEGLAQPSSETLEPRVRLDDDWSALTTDRFDLVYAALVLQHVEIEACRAYLTDFARMAPAVYLLTRTDSDFGANVLDLVDETRAFDPGPCVEVDHDPATHQLRILGHRTFAKARASGGSRHYEVLLRSRGGP